MYKFISFYIFLGVFVSIMFSGCCSEVMHTPDGDPVVYSDYGYLCLPNIRHPGTIEKQRAKFSQFDSYNNEEYFPRINAR
ncbi:MAG: hypothetical protein LBQ66_01295 [Planctomycetaceae bacterium]|nr:hypothetical protein [Planctomycetaceae bacterium]